MKLNIWKLEVRMVPTEDHIGLALQWWAGGENCLTIELLFWEIMFSRGE